MIKLKELLNESAKSDKLAKEINREIEKIDVDMSYVDLAHAVAKILNDEYGSHNYDRFLKELKRKLG